MRLGYPCINRTIGCSASHTFRLRSYSQDKLYESVEENLKCLEKILLFNIENKFQFFRISSQLVPFASHPVCQANWQMFFSKKLEKIGVLIRKNSIRISMHPDQFVLINALDKAIVEKSVLELRYHAQVLDLMKLPLTAKIQIHVGGAYGDKEKSINRFIDAFSHLEHSIQRRLVIENDDRLFSVDDCLKISSQCKIPILFDSFHAELNGNGLTIKEQMLQCAATWKKSDGRPMLDYSSQLKGGRVGSHTESIDLVHFNNFLKNLSNTQFDLMLEIKDKEKSASLALSETKRLNILD